MNRILNQITGPLVALVGYLALAAIVKVHPTIFSELFTLIVALVGALVRLSEWFVSFLPI